MSNFASEFTPIAISTAKDKISSMDKFILFIGRPSCPYCQLFEPKLSNVARNSNLTIFYINSENSEDLEDIQALRKRYGIATVPALFVCKVLFMKIWKFQKMELLRLYVTHLFLRMIF